MTGKDQTVPWETVSLRLLEYDWSLAVSGADEMMVSFQRGSLLLCDPAIKQIVLNLCAKGEGEYASVKLVQDLDDHSMFVNRDSVPLIRKKIDEHLAKMAYTEQKK
ncbi:hypothetical protein ACOME3_007140 [Neoechinorhynchus agilis]